VETAEGVGEGGGLGERGVAGDGDG
jgi:hypothetical protein